MPRFCVARGCKNRSNKADSRQKNVSFHRFPLSDPCRLERWLSVLNRDNYVPNKHAVLCSEHFDDCDFESIASGNTKRRFLKADAVPTKFSCAKSSVNQKGISRQLKIPPSVSAVPAVQYVLCKPTYVSAVKKYQTQPSFVVPEYKGECHVQSSFVSASKHKGCQTEENCLSDIQQLQSKLFCLESLSQDLCRMLYNGLGHDAELKCQDQTWKVHRHILSLRSIVLQKMLDSDVVEGHAGVITIEDMDLQTVQHFLEYLYGGKLPEMSMQRAKQFYEIGVKYAISCLRRTCSDYLVNNLSPENACEILIVADQHNDISFKQKVVDYFIQEKIVLIDSIWGDFSQNHPMLAIQVYSEFCRRHFPK